MRLIAGASLTLNLHGRVRDFEIVYHAFEPPLVSFVKDVYGDRDNRQVLTVRFALRGLDFKSERASA